MSVIAERRVITATILGSKNFYEADESFVCLFLFWTFY
jgi:hypothetical protein